MSRKRDQEGQEAKQAEQQEQARQQEAEAKRQEEQQERQKDDHEAKPGDLDQTGTVLKANATGQPATDTAAVVDSQGHDARVRAGQDAEAEAMRPEEGAFGPQPENNPAPTRGPRSSMGADGPEPTVDPMPRVKVNQLSGVVGHAEELINRVHGLDERIDDPGIHEALARLLDAAATVRDKLQRVLQMRGGASPQPDQPEQGGSSQEQEQSMNNPQQQQQGQDQGTRNQPGHHPGEQGEPAPQVPGQPGQPQPAGTVPQEGPEDDEEDEDEGEGDVAEGGPNAPGAYENQP